MVDRQACFEGVGVDSGVEAWRMGTKCSPPAMCWCFRSPARGITLSHVMQRKLGRTTYSHKCKVVMRKAGGRMRRGGKRCQVEWRKVHAGKAVE